MRINGTTVLTRKVLISRRFGIEAWRSFFDEMARTHACFRAPITASTLLPVDACLRFHDELVRRFYEDERPAAVQLGEESAAWALSSGPFREVLAGPSLKSVAQIFRELWGSYYVDTESRCEVIADGRVVDLKVLGLPDAHPYFQLLGPGYFKGALELICANTIVMERLPTVSRFDYHCVFHIGEPAALEPIAGNVDSTGLPSAKNARMRRHVPSTRQLEVLRLVALGKTNKEIGVILQISPRTVQNHIASLYDKLGLYSRVGAADWMREHDPAAAVHGDTWRE